MRLNHESLPLQVEVLDQSPPLPRPEEFEERSRMEEDRDRPIRREGHGNHKLLLQLFNQVIQSRNHKGGGFRFVHP